VGLLPVGVGQALSMDQVRPWPWCSVPAGFGNAPVEVWSTCLFLQISAAIYLPSQSRKLSTSLCTSLCTSLSTSLSISLSTSLCTMSTPCMSAASTITVHHEADACQQELIACTGFNPQAPYTPEYLHVHATFLRMVQAQQLQSQRP